MRKNPPSGARRPARRARAAIAILLVLAAGCAAPPPPDQGAGSVRVAWSGEPGSEMRRDVGEALAGAAPESLAVPPEVWEALADAGYLHARICRDSLGGWRIESGGRSDSLHVRWVDSAGRRVTEPPAFGGDIQAAGEGLSGSLEGAITALLQDYDERGYPLARVELVDHALDRGLSLDLRVDRGARFEVRGLRFVGARGTRQSYLQRLLRWRGPEPYRTRRWSEARETLMGCGLFADVRGPLFVRPTSADTTAQVMAADLAFHLRERPVNLTRGLLGYSGERETLAGLAELALGNLFGTGRAARLFWQRDGTGQSVFELEWREPFLWRLPIGMEASLRHRVENTLFAQTAWGGNLLWAPVVLWRVKAGWDWEEVVLGGDAGEKLSRTTTRFGLRRAVPDADARRRGWGLEGELARSRGDGTLLHRVQVACAQWTGAGSWGIWSEQRFGLIDGDRRILRGDALRVGGALSLRGHFEGEFRCVWQGVQRTELGVRMDERGSRAYLLLDAGWLKEWRPEDDGIYGSSGADRFLWSSGVGLRVPARGGAMRLDYGVPSGEPMWRGRLHFGVESRF